MAKRSKRAVRLPSGKYAWRGRAVQFGKLPKAQRHLFRVTWAKKAAKTRKQVAIRREKEAQIRREGIVVVFREKRKLRDGTIIPAAFLADRPSGTPIKEVVEAIKQTAKERISTENHGSWLANIEWPNDDRSDPGDPYTTVASLGNQSIDSDIEGVPESYFDEIEESGGANLDRNKSGAKGTATITTIEWAVWHGL